MSSASTPEEMSLPLPSSLKAILEDDCFWILRRGKLVHLPAEPTVEGFLREFYYTCVEGATEDTNLQLLSEVLDGIKIYFDFTLADHLLYGPEREQHKSLGIINPVLSKKTSNHANDEPPAADRNAHSFSGSLPSQVYGVIHLLRLFVKMPHFLSCIQQQASHIQILHVHFKDLLGYMCSRKQNLFLEEHYDETVPTITNNHDTESTVSENTSST